MAIEWQYFVLGASFMFSAFVAWLFWRKDSGMLSRLVAILMIVLALRYIKDAIVRPYISTLTPLALQLATVADIVAVPLYAAILVELCRPGHLTWKIIIGAEIPFVVFAVLLWATGRSVIYYIDMTAAVALGLSTAVWTIFAIPRYHRHLKATFSYDDDINLNWLQSILWAFFILLTVWALSCVVYNPWYDVLYMVCTLFLWISICYFIYRHKSVVDELKPLPAQEVITAKGDDARSEVFARIDKLINEDKIYLDSMLKLSDISRMANTNRTYASAYFSDQGRTFYDVINSLRIKHSISLLADKANTIEKVAEASGFNSRQSFARVFSSIMGVSPAQYKIQISQEKFEG